MEDQIHVLEIKHIRDVLKHTSHNSLVIFDLDNTLVESTQEVGSDQWFVSLSQYAANIMVDSAETISLVLSIYHEIQFHIDLRAVQQEAIRIIQILQDLCIPVLALTARGTKISEPTLKQLDKIGIQFHKQWDEEFSLPKDEMHAPIFRQGVIFCDGADKGKCLDYFLHYKLFSPKHVVMVDDKAKYLISVGKMLKQYHAQFVGLRYSFLDEKVRAFNWERSLEELFAITHRLPLDIQRNLKRLNIINDRQLLQANSIFGNRQTESVEHQILDCSHQSHKRSKLT